MLKLYDYELSGNCYKVRLLLAFLAIPYERVPIDFFPGREHKSSWFLNINRFGQLPVIDDDGLIIRDSQAILIYLASKYDSAAHWYPRDSAPILGNLHMWLSFAESINLTAGAARLHDSFFYDCDIKRCRADARAQFRILEEHLWFAEQAGQDWLSSGDQPTIADVACFPHVMLAEEGEISLLPYPAIRRWTDRVKRIPRFTLMPGLFDASPLN